MRGWEIYEQGAMDGMGGLTAPHEGLEVDQLVPVLRRSRADRTL